MFIKYGQVLLSILTSKMHCILMHSSLMVYNNSLPFTKLRFNNGILFQFNK